MADKSFTIHALAQELTEGSIYPQDLLRVMGKDGIKVTVTAVAEGSAVITAFCGDVTASAMVFVVNVDGNFYAYNYYSADENYGYMIDVDMGSMNYTLTADPANDYIAGDYNGHDGYFYGYTEGGQLYRYDLENNEITALGAPISGTASGCWESRCKVDAGDLIGWQHMVQYF